MAVSAVDLGIFGHSYQPPREIWLPNGEMMTLLPEVNDKIYDECYRPLFVAEGLLPGEEGSLESGIPSILSFSFFAPLRAWMKVHRAEDFGILTRRIQEMPDRQWRVFGDPLIHAILPLQSPAEQDLLIKMGKKAFERDFGFSPLGFWSPETAMSTQTMEILHKNGYKFVVLRDDQILESDHNPMYVKLPSGGEMAVFHFHKGASGEVGYDDKFTKNGDEYASKHVSRYTNFFVLGNDTETYGHHKKHADKWVRRLSRIAKEWGEFNIFSIRERLSSGEKHFTSLQEMSSWSCEHLMPDLRRFPAHEVEGIRQLVQHMQLGRWKGTCDCAFGPGTPNDVKVRVNTEKYELYESSQRVNNEISSALTSIDSQWEDRYIQAQIDYREPVRLKDGTVIRMNVQDVMLAGMDFFPILKRAVASVYSFPKEITEDELLYRFSLFAAKGYADALLTSCMWFFADEYPERQNLKKLLPAAEYMLSLAKVPVAA